VKVVSDAGPLLALAKIEGLDVLLRLYPEILVPQAVYDEVVTAGRLVSAPDAVILEGLFRARRFVLSEPSQAPLATRVKLGLGEEQSIRLAIEQNADWLLIDDRDARRVAEAELKAARVAAQIKGTLGIIVSAYQEKCLDRGEAIGLVEKLNQHLDIWLSPALCRRVIELLQA
jgi:predicted nucleic acid-binding protein